MFYSRRTKRILIGFLFLFVLLGVTVIGSFRWQSAQREKKRYEEEKAGLQATPPNRHVAELGNRAQVRQYAAVLRPWAEAEAPAEVPGRVIEVLIEPGDEVKEGQILARLEDRLARIAVELAQARLEEQQRLLAEASRLVKSRAISETQYQSVAAETRVSVALLAEARERLEKHTIRAPFAGIVNSRLVDVGDPVHQNEPVAQIIDLTQLRVEFYVSENDVAAFPRGRELSLFLPYLPGEIFTAKVDFASRSADPVTRLFRVEGILPNPGEQLPGGLQGVVEAELRHYESTVLIPTMAVRFLGRQAFVVREIAEGRSEPQEVRVGSEIDGFYPVLEGLQPGDVILVE